MSSNKRFLFYIWRTALKRYYPLKKKKKKRCFICKLYHLWGNSEHAAGTMKIRLWSRERHVVISSTEIRSHIFGVSIVAIFIIRNVITYNTPTIMTCSGPWRNVIFCNRFKDTNKCKDVLYKTIHLQLGVLQPLHTQECQYKIMNDNK